MGRYIKTYEIDRSKWVCGGGKYASRLGSTHMLNDIGRMCCLGQICKAEGVAYGALLGQKNPDTVASKSNNVPEFLYCEGMTDLTYRAVGLNDDTGLTQKEREKRLKALFKAHDIKLTFKGRLFRNEGV